MALPSDLCEEVRNIEINVITLRTKPMLYAMEMQPSLMEEICIAQVTDPQLEWIWEAVLTTKASGFVIHKDGTIRFHNQVCVLVVRELKKRILDEGHNTPHSVHPGGNKLYKDPKQTFWWGNIKQEVSNYVAKCLSSQHVKTEHPRIVGLMQPLEIPEWKWDSTSMDIMV